MELELDSCGTQDWMFNETNDDDYDDDTTTDGNVQFNSEQLM